MAPQPSLDPSVAGGQPQAGRPARGSLGVSILLLVAGTVPVALTESSRLTGTAVFALGVGWNLCFVGGSAVVSREVPPADRTAVEGAVDEAKKRLGDLLDD